MTLTEIQKLVVANGGTVEPVISWIWAVFDDEAAGLRVFEQVKDHCEHRGFCPAQPHSSNPNLQKAGFRFRCSPGSGLSLGQQSFTQEVI